MIVERLNRRWLIRTARLSVAAALVACGVAQSPDDRLAITANAESHTQWNQKLNRAVPIGLSYDSAAALLRRDGFLCSSSPDQRGRATCQKYDHLDVGLREIHVWMASFTVAKDRVVAVRGNYDHY
jgi:hypothetical protein